LSAARTEWPFAELRRGRRALPGIRSKILIDITGCGARGRRGLEAFLSWEILGFPDDLRQTEGPAAGTEDGG